jgi:glycosyltransferase involved in cell wall biosynthesis
LRRISVDLTPVHAGGENGGAKLVATTLVRQLSAIVADADFTLFTSTTSDAELAFLDAPNVHRHCIDTDIAPTNVDEGLLGASRTAARAVVNTLVPTGARRRVKDSAWRLFKRQHRLRVARATLPDVHFSPFTAPFFWDPRIPQVAIVYDLQFLAYPQFFDDQTRIDRHRHFLDACERADRLICISEFVRQSVLAHSRRPPESVETVHLALLHAIEGSHDDLESTARQILAGSGLTTNRYLLYPANAWPHKNHRVLIEALHGFLEMQPDSDLGLVCTGAPGPAFEQLQRLAADVLPPGRFAVGGFLDEREFSAVLSHCRALIYPSLYEGFGLPLVEAMARGKPVLCSNTSSLPEVAGDAAILFDPGDAAQIARAIQRLESDLTLDRTLVERGRQRVRTFGSARDMAVRYLAAFEEVVAARQRSAGR